ncbi:hypothetical protein SK432_25895, partial [Escherichia coli]|nr:hypothetical protein [Escherichia coli]
FARNRQPRGWQVVVDRRCYSDGGLGYILAGDGITFAHPVPISAGVNGERTAKTSRVTVLHLHILSRFLRGLTVNGRQKTPETTLSTYALIRGVGAKP